MLFVSDELPSLISQLFKLWWVVRDGLAVMVRKKKSSKDSPRNLQSHRKAEKSCLVPAYVIPGDLPLTGVRIRFQASGPPKMAGDGALTDGKFKS